MSEFVICNLRFVIESRVGCEIEISDRKITSQILNHKFHAMWRRRELEKS